MTGLIPGSSERTGAAARLGVPRTILIAKMQAPRTLEGVAQAWDTAFAPLRAGHRQPATSPCSNRLVCCRRVMTRNSRKYSGTTSSRALALSSLELPDLSAPLIAIAIRSRVFTCGLAYRDETDARKVGPRSEAINDRFVRTQKGLQEVESRRECRPPRLVSRLL